MTGSESESAVTEYCFKMKKYLNYPLVSLKGMCMGAADVVPGVSGGTIAFMTGIYETLVGSINSIDATAVKLLFTGKIRDFWKHINGTFLVFLAAGILISVFSLAKLMQFLLANHPVQTWAFFFGLIVASSIFILNNIEIPAVLVECGFLSNPEDTKKLNDPNERAKIAATVFAAICESLTNTEAS